MNPYWGRKLLLWRKPVTAPIIGPGQNSPVFKYSFPLLTLTTLSEGPSHHGHEHQFMGLFTIQMVVLFFFFLWQSQFSLFILFMAVLGFCFCARAFSSCGKWGPLFIAVRGPLIIAASRCGAQAPDAQAQQLWLTGPVAPRHVGSSQARARTCVPCIGRQILNHCATREAPDGSS